MTEQPPPGPTAASVSMRNEFSQFQREGLASVRSSAASWRDGLALLVTVLTGVLVISGPSVAELPIAGRIGVVGGLIGGAFALVYALLTAVLVAAGKPHRMSYEEFAESGGRVAIEAQEAQIGVKRLRRSRAAAIVGIAAVLLAVGAWMLIPPDTPAAVAPGTEKLEGN